LFKDSFPIFESRRVDYKVEVTEGKMKHLLKMTPLLWGNLPGAKDLPQLLKQKELSVDLTVLVGWKAGWKDLKNITTNLRGIAMGMP
jgi:hypothetical protein